MTCWNFGIFKSAIFNLQKIIVQLVVHEKHREIVIRPLNISAISTDQLASVFLNRKYLTTTA